MSIDMTRNFIRLLTHFRRHDLEAFADEHERLFAEAQKTKNHGPVTSHYYSVMSKVIDEYFNGNFHFVPPLKENQTLEEALHSLHLRIGDELHLAPGIHCLDVGCGIGTVQIGNSNFEAAGIQNECKLVEADCKKMPFEDNTFDCAYAIYSLKKVVSALEYACGMPPLHWRSEMIEKSTTAGLELIGSADLSKETGRPFHYSFSHSPSFMWMVNSNALARLIKIGSPTALADKQLYDSIQNVLKQDSQRAVFIPAGAFWGSNDVKKMADLGTLRAMTITMIKHPSSFKVRGALVDLCEQALKENQPIVIFEGPVRLLCPLAPNNVNTMAGAAIAAHNLGFDHTLKEWHIVEYELKGENGFCIKLRRENPAKPGAVTGDSTYFAFLSSVIGELNKMFIDNQLL
ncbi:Methyltransferase [Aphelenchoides besseyi]|nr:Methyltransferase [Aphelenchoides besseyi]